MILRSQPTSRLHRFAAFAVAAACTLGWRSAVAVGAPAPATVRAADAPWTLAAPRARAVAVRSSAGFSLVGGLDASNQSTADIASVDVTTGTSRGVGRLAEAVHDAAGVRRGRSILVFGGGGPTESGTADVQQANASGTSTVVGRLPTPRSDLVAVSVGRAVYLLGGYDGSAITPYVLRTLDGRTFTSVAALPVPVRYPAVAVVGASVYVFGGVYDSAGGLDTAAVQRLDTRTGRVTTVAQLPAALSHASAIVRRGQVYLLGGYVGSTHLSDQILHFDPATGTATPAGRLPTPVSDGAAVVIGGRAYLAGGEGADRRPRAIVTVLNLP
jgi:hypothetical protein